MSAPDIERLADVIVEHTPGDRLLAERIAGAVWDEMLRPLEVLVRQWEYIAEHASHAEDRSWTRAAASSLRAAMGPGRVSERPGSASSSDRQPAASGGPMRGDGDGTSEGEKR